MIFRLFDTLTLNPKLKENTWVCKIYKCPDDQYRKVLRSVLIYILHIVILQYFLGGLKMTKDTMYLINEISLWIIFLFLYFQI